MPTKTAEVKGVVENVIQGKKCPIIRINGEGYFVWDSPLRKDITDNVVKPGVELSLTFIPGQWPKAVSWKVLGQKNLGDSQAPAPKESVPSSVPGAISAEKDSILRSVALKASVELVCRFDVNIDSRAAAIRSIYVAEELLAWLKK